MSTTNPTPAELAYQTWMLACEAGMVIWMRSLVMMSGGAGAEREGRRMVSEKLTAGMTLLPAMLGNGLPASAEVMGARVVEHYAKPVRANRKRLTRKG